MGPSALEAGASHLPQVRPTISTLLTPYGQKLFITTSWNCRVGEDPKGRLVQPPAMWTKIVATTGAERKEGRPTEKLQKLEIICLFLCTCSVRASPHRFGFVHTSGPDVRFLTLMLNWGLSLPPPTATQPLFLLYISCSAVPNWRAVSLGRGLPASLPNKG